ncbi:MAG TPA: peptide ABC transporter substrate-binding protein [Chloroflexaceae bacterium]|nr:peptide ABC transporter substrate-binding protein [Chloroflexaceae bacterium]
MRNIQIWCLLLVALVLAGCEIEGGVARPTPAAVLPTASPAAPPAGAATVTGATSGPMATVGPEPTALSTPEAPIIDSGGVRIGLLADPGDLLPYHTDSADERATAPISELIFPAPLLAVGYTYTTTGVLERVPTVENGDVTVGQVDVFLDQTGAITTTTTDVITQVQQISVIFRWNPDLTWSDGAPLTAADSVFAYELARRAGLGQETRSKLDLLERYEQVDEHTTRAVLKPDYTDPAYLTTFFTPLPRHLLEGGDPAELRSGQFALLPVGYGPYAVARRDQGSLRLERNPHYAGPTGPIETVSFIFRDNLDLLRSSVAGGSLDVAALDQPLPEDLAAIRADGDAGALQVGAVASPIWEHLDFNLDVPALQDLRVRRAIAQAINREAMVAELLGGYGAVLDSWIVPGQWAAAPTDQLTRYPYSPDEARRLLDEAGIVDGDGDGLREASGQPLTLSLVTTQASPLRLAAAQRIRDDLAAIGVGLSLQEVPTGGLYSPEGPLFRRTFQMALFAWIASPDPRGWERWSCAGVPSASNGWTGNNFPGWCFFEADRAIRLATTSLDRTEREAAYLRQQQLFTQELPVLPLFQRVDLVLASPTLEGVTADPTAPFTWNIAGWSRK